jgi:hypothetical protein
MIEDDAANCIVRFLSSTGMKADEYVCLSYISRHLLSLGLDFEDVEDGLVKALQTGWIQLRDNAISFTDEGSTLFTPANDNHFILQLD